MVQVYLPFGYPIVTGNEFANVIYQGTMVRLYTLPTDPRSDAQQFERKFLSDVTKTRSMLGLWGRGALRAALGSKWATVLYQIIKADVGSWWSTAVEAWDGFGESNQDAWRSANPYQACFNDLGKIFYCLAWTVNKALVYYSGAGWESAEWGETDSAAALAWWADDLSECANNEGTDDADLKWHFDATWQTIIAGGASSGHFKQGDSAQISASYAYLNARTWKLYYVVDPNFGNLEVWVDGQLSWTIAQYAAARAYGWHSERDMGYRGLHRVEFRVVSGQGSVDLLYGL